MLQYASSRVLQALPLLLLISVASFAIMHLAPGGPLTAFAHTRFATPQRLRLMEQQMGLDAPWYVQYFRWLGAILGGNWGFSYQDGRPVLVDIAERIPATALLMFASFLLSITCALIAGIVSAVRQYSRLDYTLTFASFFAWAMPTFWFALMAQIVLGVDLRLLPVSGMTGGSGGALSVLYHLIMPTLVLGLTSIASWSRYLRSSLFEVLSQPFMITARAKGNAERRALFRHALKNALIPLVTIMGLDVPSFFTGAVITETIFSWPGMGQLFYQALQARDYPVEMGLLMISAVLIIIGNLLADLFYAVLDPRIRLGARLGS